MTSIWIGLIIISVWSGILYYLTRLDKRLSHLENEEREEK